jgi:uncharacterized protein YlxW (UPF0749 family)
VTVPEQPPGSALPARVTTPLLTLITQQSLDEDYQHVAEQRRDGTRSPSARTGRSMPTVAAVLVFGVLLAIAAVQTAQSADVASAGREQLISRIEARRSSLADLQDRIARVRSGNAAAQARYAEVGRRLDALDATRTALLVRTGFGATSGPGIAVVVDDAPGGGANGQVRDDDLALLVNGLWQAGATGVSVNGQRVTALSGLRNSGETIRINGVSLSPPYTVLATGDTRTLQADLAESTSGAEFEALTEQLGMPTTIKNREGVRLNAAPTGMMTLHRARSGTPTKPPVTQEETP